MKRRIYYQAVVLFALAFAGAVRGGRGMEIVSQAFPADGRIPERYAYCGAGAANLSPPLRWRGEPPETESYVLIMHDPDASVGDFVHWVVYDIPASAVGLPEGVSGKGGFPEGRNDYGSVGYGGPCPPPGRPHRYVFDLYALAVPSLGLPAGMSAAEVLAAAKPHILARAQLIGLFSHR